MFCDITTFPESLSSTVPAGNVQGSVRIVNGEVNRTNKTWNFEASNGTKFQAKLLNGNMVNGTGQQPTDESFTFEANHNSNS